jgi:hypothetical protein
LCGVPKCMGVRDSIHGVFTLALMMGSEPANRDQQPACEIASGDSCGVRRIQTSVKARRRHRECPRCRCTHQSLISEYSTVITLFSINCDWRPVGRTATWTPRLEPYAPVIPVRVLPPPLAPRALAPSNTFSYMIRASSNRDWRCDTTPRLLTLGRRDLLR